MIHDGYYVIRPSKALQTLLGERHAAEDAALFLEPQLWHNPEIDRSHWQPQDYIQRVKRAFVARLADMASDDPKLSWLSLDLPPTVDNFDQWWIVERFAGYDEELPNVEQLHGLENSQADEAG